MVLFGLEAHNWTQKQIRAGVIAADVAKKFYDFYVENGFKDNFVYGPMHGTGLIEVEAPWVETISNYPFEPNMTFQIDTYISTDTFGVRWEKGIGRDQGRLRRALRADRNALRTGVLTRRSRGASRPAPFWKGTAYEPH